MEVHFQFNGKEYGNCFLKNHLGSKEFKRSLIGQFIIYIALILLFALRIRYRSIRYAVFIAGFIGLFFVKKSAVAAYKKNLYALHGIKNDDVRVMHIKLNDNSIDVGQVMIESTYAYEAVREAYVMGEYLFIKFINNRIAFVHSRAFRDADSAKKFVECLEKKADIKVYRKKDELVK